jgi:hypothetical protein
MTIAVAAIKAGPGGIESISIPLIPAKAGIQGNIPGPAYWALDSRVRGNERVEGQSRD